MYSKEQIARKATIRRQQKALAKGDIVTREIRVGRDDREEGADWAFAVEQRIPNTNVVITLLTQHYEGGLTKSEIGTCIIHNDGQTDTIVYDWIPTVAGFKNYEAGIGAIRQAVSLYSKGVPLNEIAEQIVPE